MLTSRKIPLLQINLFANSFSVIKCKLYYEASKLARHKMVKFIKFMILPINVLAQVKTYYLTDSHEIGLGFKACDSVSLPRKGY